jgi:thioredoxin-related protein
MGSIWQRGATLRRLILACAFALSAAARADGIDSARDFTADGKAARDARRVIVVLFSTTGCPWCERVRREYLQPMLANPDDRARILVREIDVDGSEPLTDFAGAPSSHAAFAARYAVRFTPTVMVFGPEGRTLAPPLIGFSTADYYGYYLEERITAGLAKLKR